LERSLKYKGYDIYTAESANAAFEILQVEAIDLIVTDEKMPGLSGTDLLSVVRRVHPEIIRIMLTGVSDMEVIKNAVNKGEIYRFFTKPWDDFELSIAVRQGLAQKTLEEENTKLKGMLNHHEKVMDELEKQFPGITQKKISDDGSLILEGQ
jgi:DNA-binding NtrC family response regulator